jgi:alpha-tubulin suppressor-like RCC1 family protein
MVSMVICFQGTGSIFMWGCNKFGQCGLNPNDSQTVLIPNKVLLPTQLAQDNVVSVASGWTHVIARTGL